MRITITYRINNSNTKEKYVIAVFYNTDDLLCLTDFIKKSGLYLENISLYKYNRKYIIIFPYVSSLNKKIFHLKEFGKVKFVCENTVSHIIEYGHLICNDLTLLLK